MATDVERLAVLIEANTKSYERAMAKLSSDTDRALRGMEKRFKDSADKLDGMFSTGLRRAGALLAGYASLRGVQEVVNAFKDLAKIGDISQRIGTTTDFLQALRFTVQQNGGELTDADAAMQKFADALGEAATGTTYLTKLFNANNVALKDKRGNLRAVDDMLLDFARLVNGATSPQEKMMLVTEAFGKKAGPAMLVALEEIAQKGLPGMIAGAKEAGAVVDKELIARAKIFDDEWDKAVLSATNNIKSFIIKAIDGLIDFDRKIRASKKELEQLGSAPSTMEGIPGLEPPPAGADIPAALPGGGMDESGFAGPWGAPKKTAIPRKGGDDGFEKALEQAKKRIDIINAETATIGMNSEARARAKLVAEIDAAAKEANSQAGMKNAGVTEAQSRQIGQLADKMLEAERKSREMETAFRSVNQTTEFLGNTAQSAFENILDGADAATTAVRALRSELLKAVFTGQGAFAQMLGTASTVQGQTGGIFGMLGALFGGGRATGGQVMPGRAYLVNEQTPRSEIFVPQVAGRIEQNKGGGMGGGTSRAAVVIHQSFHNTFSGMTGSDRQWSEARMAQIASQAKQAAVAEVRAAPQRRG